MCKSLVPPMPDALPMPLQVRKWHFEIPGFPWPDSESHPRRAAAAWCRRRARLPRRPARLPAFGSCRMELYTPAWASASA